MATLEKIRNRAGLLVIVVGVALFAFIIGDFLNSGSTFFRQSHEKIAEVDGETITIQDYQERIDEMTEVYKMQMGTPTIPEEYTTNIRQTVFDTMVQDIVLNEAMDKIGMTVGKEELYDMVQGENISPMIQQMQMFTNPQTGMFDKTALLQFLKTINDDDLSSYPGDYQAQIYQARSFWLFWEKNIKRQRMEQKYTTLLSKAVSANALDAKAAYEETAQSADIAYVSQSFASIPDSTVSVSKGEIESLYNQRKEYYKQKESKVIKYIAVDIRPSQDDYNKVSAEIEGLKDEFMATSNVAELVNENSDIPYTNFYVAEEALDAEARQFVLASEPGEVFGPIFEDNTYKMLKLVDKINAPDSVRISHIMLPNTGSESAQLLDSLQNVLRNGGNFEEIVSAYSMDQQSAENGGDLGWFTEIGALMNLGEEFKDVIFTQPLNQIAVVNSLYGSHLVKVTERTANVPKYKIANIQMVVYPSSRTYSDLYNELNQFISKNRDINSWTENAQEAGYHVNTATVTANDQMLGAIKNSRPVIRWAFQNGKGKVSDIIEGDETFVVAAVEGTIKEGYRSLASVEPSLRSEIAAKKKGEKIANELAARNLSSLDGYAQAMDSRIDSVKFVSFGTRRISGIGVEPKLNAAVSLAQVNQVSAPVAGDNAVYVFQITEKHQDSGEFNEAEQINAWDSANTYRFGFQAVQYLTNKADIKDNRIRFY